MKKLLIVGLTIIVCSSTQVKAQLFYGFGLNINTPTDFPTGDLSEHFNTGIGFQANAFYFQYDRMFFKGSLGYDHFFAKSDPQGFRSSIIPLTISANFAADDGDVQPYISGGLGVYMRRTTLNVLSTPTEQTDNKIGVNLGVGIMINNINFAANYHMTQEFAYARVHVGILFARY